MIRIISRDEHPKISEIFWMGSRFISYPMPKISKFLFKLKGFIHDTSSGLKMVYCRIIISKYFDILYTLMW